MTGQRHYTAFCGLYCEDCIPSRSSLFEAVQGLAGELDRLDFRRYAALKAESTEIFSGYERFREYLSAIASLRCPGPCAEGGGKKDCAIRACAKEKGYAGCWECGIFETCKLLLRFQRFHGDTPINNLRLIREHGPDNWARHRGPHYLWSKRPS
jgi:hypothetical protein